MLDVEVFNMAVAKNPGIGQGRGGGRPKGKASKPNRPQEEREVKPIQLRLSAHAAELVQAAAEAGKVRPWRVVELAILAALEGAPGPDASPALLAGLLQAFPGAALPPEAQEIAQECAAFLEAQEDRPTALKALRRAWKQALALARHELTPAPAPDSTGA